jgi:hypothetical protein
VAGGPPNLVRRGISLCCHTPNPGDETNKVSVGLSLVLHRYGPDRVRDGRFLVLMAGDLNENNMD